MKNKVLVVDDEVGALALISIMLDRGFTVAKRGMPGRAGDAGDRHT
ncbi:MAG: hypothetical protein IPK19_13055 [Chloroflexi bacterium]|nr:hypothetical protein [Chloroflexota bacterium]